MKKPLSGFRLFISKFLHRFFAIAESIVFGYYTVFSDVEFDYSYYLGPDYKETQKKYTHPSTIVSNHSSYHDHHVLGMRFAPCFVAGIHASKGLVGLVYKTGGTCFIDSLSNSEDARL